MVTRGFCGILANATKHMANVLSRRFASTSMPAIDQVVNSAAKTYYMSAGRVSVPIVFRGANGAGVGVAAQH
uniref:Pyruvate dehydrogenase E1 component subunit beta n=1 Tax=Parascaris equorum TaxID=6256 RepID=A0A914RGP3_PAREQ